MPVGKHLIQDSHMAPRLKKFKRRNPIFVSDLHVISFYLLAVKPMLDFFRNRKWLIQLFKTKDKTAQLQENKNISWCNIGAFNDS